MIVVFIEQTVTHHKSIPHNNYTHFILKIIYIYSLFFHRTLQIDFFIYLIIFVYYFPD